MKFNNQPSIKIKSWVIETFEQSWFACPNIYIVLSFSFYFENTMIIFLIIVLITTNSKNPKQNTIPTTMIIRNLLSNHCNTGTPKMFLLASEIHVLMLVYFCFWQ